MMIVMAKKAIVLLAVFMFSYYLFTAAAVAVFDCLTLTQASTPDEKQFCRDELNKIEQELANLEARQEGEEKNAGTLKGDLTLLTSKINKLKVKIKARALAITQLKIDIEEKVSTIETLSEKLDRQNESLAQLLRKVSEMDKNSIFYFALSSKNISDFYGDIDAFQSINRAINKSVKEVNATKDQTEKEKNNLEEKQNAEEDARAELQSSQNKVKKTEAQKKDLLSVTKKNISAYEKLKAVNKAIANKIRAKLFSLRDTTAIPFEEALRYANEARDKTGVDPAFLLAIITQESELGANVGKCNVAGAPSWKTIMPGPSEYLNYIKNGESCKKAKGACSWRDDQTAFKNIVEGLGMSTENTPLSCPQKSVGPWGGAMGPAQFIPTTWKGFQKRLQNTLGHLPNPWTPRDAFLASAMYLTDLGAIGNSASAQKKAACKYFGSCKNYNYGGSVMKLKYGIQDNIDLLSN